MKNDMSPLEALEEIKRQVGNIHYFDFTQNMPTMTTIPLVDTTLFKIVENALKALEIIKKRECIFKGLSETTQEEFDLLKEIINE